MPELARLPTPCARCGYLADTSGGAVNFCPQCGGDLRAAAREPPGPDDDTGARLGQVIAERYRLEAVLGEGGMGTVYRAEHVRMGKALALKLVRAGGRDPAALARFRAEAQIVSRLSHPHTIAVFDFGELGRHGCYLAMEYVPGRDLAALLAEAGRLPEARAAALGEQILASLAEAHQAGVVHRDVKPANVMVMATPQGDFVKVLDFGIAQLRDAPAAAGGAGLVAGTPSYLAPEQARALPVDGRADLYAVGALLYELVAGRPPFVGPTPMAIVSAHLREAPRPLGELAAVSPGFAAIVHRALAKRPEERFPSAQAMGEALAALGGPGAPPRRAALPARADGVASRADFAEFERELRAMRRARMAGPAAALAALALVGATAWRWSDVYPLLAARAPRAAALLPAALRPADFFDGEEHEPNDAPVDANLVPLPPGPDGRPAGGVAVIRGAIGARRDQSTGDVDVYRIDVPDTGRRVALVAAWGAAGAPDQGIPGLDVQLTLNRDRGAGVRRQAPLVAQADRGGPGRPERLTALAEPGTYYLAVRERHAEGAAPAERPADRYVLRVWLEQPRPGEEVEPNDAPEAGDRAGLRYGEWKELAERNALGEAGLVAGETSPDDPDTYAVTGAGPGDAPRLLLLLPEPGLALTAQLWIPDAEDLAPAGAGERVRFAEAGEGEPGRALALPLPAAPSPGAPALLRLRAASGAGRYEVLAVGPGARSAALVRGRIEALAAAGRGAQALELADAFARALPGAAGVEEVRAAAARLPVPAASFTAPAR